MLTSPSDVLSVAIAWLDGGSIPTTTSGDVANDVIGDMDGNSSSSSSSSSNGSSGSSSGHSTTPVANAISLLLNLRGRISRDGSLASSNEILEDVPTSSLELLGVEYHLGRAHLMLPQSTPDDGYNCGSPQSAIVRRRKNVKSAIEYYFAFLKGLERLGEYMLESETLVEYHRLLDNDVDDDDDDNDGDNSDGHMNDNRPPRRSMNNRSRTNPALMRGMKIRHYQRKKTIETRKQQYQSQLQRRSRLKLSNDDILDGYDNENLVRAYHIETLRHYAENSLGEISSSMLELEMLQMSLRMNSSCSDSNSGNGNDSRMATNQRTAATTTSTQQQQQQQQQPLQMTQIVKNPLNGELVLLPMHASNGQLVNTTTSIIKRTDIADTIFRPSWNLPTMSLQQLGDIERADAIRRSEMQQIVESQAMFQPRRYDQLVRDGMEDDDNLVEQSAKLDREWDDWKDENPKGCGNKMSERGDRNF